MTSLVCTLAHGDYHVGAAALANSLAANGFRGELWIATSQEQIPWSGHHDGTGYFSVSDEFVGRIVPHSSKGSLVLEKPRFLLDAIESRSSDFDDFFFIDADIIVSAPWNYFKKWVTTGVALCCDVNDPYMSPTHPVRAVWNEKIQQSGRSTRPITGYFNSGFLGLRIEQIELLRTWLEYCEWFGNQNPDVRYISSRDHTKEWPVPDQDLLNAAVMATDVPVSIAGPSAMGFEYGRTLMLHSIGANKPWRKFFVLEALKGYPPSRADKAFWNASQQHLRAFSNTHLLLKRIDIAAASIINRFYRR